LHEVSSSIVLDRLDPSYYEEEYLEAEKSLDLIGKLTKIKNIEDLPGKAKSSAFYESIALDYKEAGVPFIRVADINEMTVSESDLVYVSEEVFRTNRSIAHVNDADIVISKGGATTGRRIGVVPHWIKRACISRDVIGISLPDRTISDYVMVFLNTTFGQRQLLRGISQQAQPHLELEYVKRLRVPLLDARFRSEISHKVRQSFRKREQARDALAALEQELLRVLGIKEMQFPDSVHFEIDNLRILESGRFDSEYFRPEYKAITDALRSSKYPLARLSKIMEISEKTIEPADHPDTIYKYVELADVSPSTNEIVDWSEVSGHEASPRARMLLAKGDVLVPSLAGSLDNVALVPAELDGAIGSTGFFVVRSSQFHSEFLFALFRSKLLKKQIEQRTSGTILAAIGRDCFEDILVPLVPKPEQQQVCEIVRSAFQLISEMKRLQLEAKTELHERIETLLK